MNKRDQEYIDSVVEIASQELRHFYDMSDEQVIKLMRDSLDRIERETTKNIQKSYPTDSKTETKERRIHLESNRLQE